MILIVGLGNPDKKYENTYHNIGFLTIDALNVALGGAWNKKYGNAVVSEVRFEDEKIILAKPQTYMNLSGESVLAIKNKFKIENENILILLDDVDLPVGKMRFRASGSAGTHNGLKSIVNLLSSTEFPRLRIGIGKNENMDLADYVLSKINSENMSVLQEVILQAVDYIENQFLKEKKS